MTAVAIVTAYGFTMLENETYVEAVRLLRPDIVIGMGDIIFGAKPGVKRLDKMADRTLDWFSALVKGMQEGDKVAQNTALFAPILPIDPELQHSYVNALQDNFRDSISGLAVYARGSAEDIPSDLNYLPTLHAGSPGTPQQLLDVVEVGVDLLTVPFVNEATDAGVALDFAFTETHESAAFNTTPFYTDRKALGVDMWSPQHATDLSPLSRDCDCYACQKHHRAYLQHLLSAKEMLAWVLLQIHNYRVLDRFFAGIRQSIQDGTFVERREKFDAEYQDELPAAKGAGPR